MISHKYHAVFVRVARTASSTLVKTFERQDAQFIALTVENYQHDTNHLPLKCITLADSRAKDYFKFTIIRNPYDRIVSGYRYYCEWMKHFNKSRSHPTFPEFVRKLYDQWTQERVKYTDQYSQTMGCDYVGRYETLRSSYEHICSHINIQPIELVDRNRTHTHWCTPFPPKEHDNYQDYYDSDTKNLVTLMNEQDLHEFEYSF